MIFSRTIKAFLAGLLTVAVLTIAPTGLTPPAHAEMSHGSFDQDCLSSCMSSNPSLVAPVPNQNPEEEQSREAEEQPEPYYVQFMPPPVPKKLVSLVNEAAYILRPPDLVKLYVDYRD